MSKLNNIAIILSFVGLWLTSLVTGEFEVLIAFFLIFTFGILHGSNDILLIYTISNSKKSYPFLHVITTYLLTVFTAVVLFYFFPLIALLLFIIFSAFHFGQQHWEYRNLNASNTIKNIYYLIYGLVILNLLFIFNTQEVIEVIGSITNYTLPKEVFWQSLVVFGFIMLALAARLAFKSESFRNVIILEFFYILVFCIIFKTSTLIWGFALYFILWHSMGSLYEQISFIYGNFNKKNIMKYCKKAFPYWLISIIGIGIIYLIFKDEKLFYAIFFSFIAAVTFPHTLVINKLFLKKKTQPN